MKAIVQDKYGPPTVLRFDDVATPVPGDDEVLVRVRASSVNARDWHYMRGDPYIMRPSMGLTRPKQRIQGLDFAGVVEAVGAKVTRLRPGDEVYGMSLAAFAEYVCAGPEEVDLKPANLTFEQAAAVPVAAGTALGCLPDVDSGHRVLINGASGGVGTFAVQLARSLGAHVTAVCSARNADQAVSLGADVVVDYAREDFTRGDARYDLVVDLVGNHSLGDLRRALAPDGTVVLSGGGVSTGGSLFGPMGLFIRGALASRVARQKVLAPALKQSRATLATLRTLIEAGRMTPVIDRVYPLSDAAAAIRYLEVDHARAKVVLTV
ncbi:NAD(P)-dependent alcohol dehydrogenase [Luedemannella flava]|uniref:NAD(P)-dependent alcohol dehydrogenase n=1 Tax=Luedemannella flava TaxID=349316 RepID=A0ABN2LND4_9ACTN